MLALTCARAGVCDGMRILDLGCGWGSLSRWLAERYPAARPGGLQLARQREWIRSMCAAGAAEPRGAHCGRQRLRSAEARFDRVVSIEMFEHMRNWEALLERSRPG